MSCCSFYRGDGNFTKETRFSNYRQRKELHFRTLASPSIVSTNCNEELTVLVQPQCLPIAIPARSPVAIAITSPPNIEEQLAESHLMSTKNMNTAPEDFWREQIGCNQPELTCSLTHNNKTIEIAGLLDTICFGQRTRL